MIFTKETKKKLKKLNRIFFKNINLSWEAGASIFGFIIVQIFWIFLLRSFIALFALWFIELIESPTLTIFLLTKTFWVIYGCWFFANIFIRMIKIKYYNEK